MTATLFGLIGILLFIAFRYDWTYAAGAVIAVFHDVLMVLAFFSIFQWEINLTVIAAILTIVGFSVNDSIVIFDRVRENLAVNRTDSLFKITNDSINQTLSRTVITAGLVLLSVLALVVFGGEVLKSFSLALLVGVTLGTYSTIAIASPIAIWWQSKLGLGKVKQGSVHPPDRKWRRRHAVRSPAGPSRDSERRQILPPRKRLHRENNEPKIFREKLIKTSVFDVIILDFPDLSI